MKERERFHISDDLVLALAVLVIAASFAIGLAASLALALEPGVL